MKKLKTSLKILLALAVIFVIVGAILKINHVSFANSILSSGITFAISGFICGAFDNKK